ncbi:MAG: nucleoside-diphosphate kinase [Waddliaceae bacterium]|jgi:nucleoside-diphosphate kinase|nr:nucleoside-diphosphate kinase [Waddliaceae bacterium]MBT3578467.1 nucleoside-diphosphate kinase [Waddliaceae bacterium]MBT4445092.1 nucleoside-diphosphate kinase [Waddliaceae bacterium]MBT6927887.1 nucleoside-diphosphate kinase [Waddliaceae bacterium]MBT7264837.1 nucleoside-diphosphate kinase [Waddliaceae bacterium]
MTVEQTLSIVKPNAINKNKIGEVLSYFESGDLKIIAAKMLHLTKEQAEGFYAVHKERPFFADLVEFMTSGPVLIQVLEGDNAVNRNREIMGATNPADAAEGTIRIAFGDDIQNNAVHGSDSVENAKIEIDFFFSANEIFSR